MIAAIEQCLEDLKPEYRAFIELRWKRNLSYSEIVEELNRREHKVKHTLSRVKNAMKNRITGSCK